MPFPGAEGDADEHGHFDDCEICRALRAGDEAGAIELARSHPNGIDGSQLLNLDLGPFRAWLESEGIDPDLH
ncbi:MAG TPA: hypothetical protein VFG69_03860 [Nannocystaceae bacterium]|nr:hypothetical protein [Nannocystaceae bacterium]